jgi:hypothetical protein
MSFGTGRSRPARYIIEQERSLDESDLSWY